MEKKLLAVMCSVTRLGDFYKHLAISNNVTIM